MTITDTLRITTFYQELKPRWECILDSVQYTVNNISITLFESVRNFNRKFNSFAQILYEIVQAFLNGIPIWCNVIWESIEMLQLITKLTF